MAVLIISNDHELLSNFKGNVTTMTQKRRESAESSVEIMVNWPPSKSSRLIHTHSEFAFHEREHCSDDVKGFFALFSVSGRAHLWGIMSKWIYILDGEFHIMCQIITWEFISFSAVRLLDSSSKTGFQLVGACVLPLYREVTCKNLWKCQMNEGPASGQDSGRT